MATVTRADLTEAVREEAGIRRRDATELVDTPIEAICARLVAGEAVRVHGFGTFDLRDKRARLGRNPRTGEEADIAPRRVVVFRPSRILKRRVADGMAKAMQDAKLR